MTERLQIYKCEVCSNIIEVIHAGGGELVCCNQPMTLMEEKTADATTEKHVPVVEKTDGGIKVKVGSVPHPMLNAHYIEWIEVLADGKAYRKFLNPGDTAEAFFAIEGDDITAREFCNVILELISIILN